MTLCRIFLIVVEELCMKQFSIKNTKDQRYEVIMPLHIRLGFSTRSTQRWIQGGTKIDQWRAPSPKDFFRSECNSNKPNASSSYPELKYRDCLLFWMISQIWQSCFLINHFMICLKLTCHHINHRHFCFNIKSISVHPLLWMNVMLDFICMVFAGMWTTFR